MMGLPLLLSMDDASFTLLLLICTGLLYGNSLWGGYVWDDRAAIVTNLDVHGKTSLLDVFSHDFWGQDITLQDSHKSYRPITTLSYRLNYRLHGLDASGYHIANVLIYAAAVCAAYRLCCQWQCPAYVTSSGSAAGNRKGLLQARIAALLFCCHPVHVEAVASLVGRADALCGLFAFVAVAMYSSEVQRCSRATEGGAAMSSRVVFAHCCAVLASLAKEVGVTVFGVFAAVEVIAIVCSGSSGSKSALSAVLAAARRRGVWQRGALCGCALVVFAAVRLAVNGPHRLYKWSILENHISLEPSLLARVLSYQQAFFWYLAKLLFPRYLCFDYGYACVPVIESLADPRALLPVMAVALLLWVLCIALRSRSAPLLLGLALLLLPLVPALNAIFPVGTILAERLLFIPSLGASIIASEMLSLSVRALIFPTPTGADRLGVVRASRQAATFVTIVLCALCAGRIVTRNSVWSSERAIYRSALDVCPFSVKALSNYAYLSQGDDPQGALRGSALARALLPPHSPAATASTINYALASTRVGLHVRSMALLAQLLRRDPANAKAAGYLGLACYSFGYSLGMGVGPAADVSARMVVLHESRRLLLHAVQGLGFSNPLTLYTLGCACLELGLLEEATQHLRRAAEVQLSLMSQPPGVPVQDDISIVSVYNQLGAALARRGLASEAAAAMQEGIAVGGSSAEKDGSVLALLANLGNVLREQGQLERAAEVFERGLLLAQQQKRPCSALLNNYGLVFRDAKDLVRALSIWREALAAAEVEALQKGGAVYTTGTGETRSGDIVSVVRANMASVGLQG